MESGFVVRLFPVIILSADILHISLPLNVPIVTG
jgi:hypothetical protein